MARNVLIPSFVCLTATINERAFSRSCLPGSWEVAYPCHRMYSTDIPLAMARRGVDLKPDQDLTCVLVLKLIPFTL
jgi:hypothetical protein